MNVVEILRENETAEAILFKLKKMDESRLRELYYLAQGMELAKKQEKTREEVKKDEGNKSEGNWTLPVKTKGTRGAKEAN